MSVENMVTKVIRRYGFENSKTLWFCRYIENHNKNEVATIYNRIMGKQSIDCLWGG